MSEASIESNDLTFEVTRAGRRFPSLSEAHHSPPQNRIRQLQRQPLDDELPKQLSQAISQRLAWHELSPLSSPARETVATAYINSLKTLNEFYHDIRTVICEACRANLEFRTDENVAHVEARDKILGDKLEEMMMQAFSPDAGTKNRDPCLGCVADRRVCAVFDQQLKDRGSSHRREEDLGQSACHSQ